MADSRKIRAYSELIKLPTFLERYRYLKLGDRVGKETFGFDRYLNQLFYHTPEWKAIRKYVILRDSNGNFPCDLGISDREITGRVLIHHINPISERDIKDRSDLLLNPEYLICVSHLTHEAIHYGDESLLFTDSFTLRQPNDTSPWK